MPTTYYNLCPAYPKFLMINVSYNSVFLLNEITNRRIFQGNDSFGLYRDDFGSVSHKPIRELEHVEKKALKALFAEHGLELEAFSVGKSVNFLDVNLDLKTGKHSYCIR